MPHKRTRTIKTIPPKRLREDEEGGLVLRGVALPLHGVGELLQDAHPRVLNNHLTRRGRGGKRDREGRRKQVRERCEARAEERKREEEREEERKREEEEERKRMCGEC